MKLLNILVLLVMSGCQRHIITTDGVPQAEVTVIEKTTSCNKFLMGEDPYNQSIVHHPQVLFRVNECTGLSEFMVSFIEQKDGPDKGKLRTYWRIVGVD